MTVQFWNTIEKQYKETQSIAITHKYMTVNFPFLAQVFEQKVAGLN